MQFTGWSSFAASRADVWALLIDPTHLAPCLPVRVPIVDRGDGRYRAEGRVGSGWLSTTLGVDLDVADVEPDLSLRVLAKGGASGTTFQGWVAYVLRPGPAEGPTVVDWEVDLTFSGGFAGQAARIVEGRGAEELDRLWLCLRSRVEI